MLHDVGMDQADMDNTTAVNLKIQQIEQQFHLVLIKERLEEWV